MNKKIIAFLFVILLSLVLRVTFPLSDLSPNISISGSIYTDEGNQCHNSRAKYIYNDWYPDDWRITHYNPILPWFKLLIFKLFGCGLLQIRVVSQLFAFLTLIIFFLSLKEIFNYKYALMGTFLYGINFLMIMYSRIGTFETPMIFWLYFSVYLLILYEKKSKGIFLALSTISAFMAFIFKNISIYFLPVPFTAILLYYLFTDKNLKISKIFKPLAYLLTGLIISFSFWLFLFYLPNREWIISAPGKYIGNQMVPKTVSQAIGNFWGFNWKEEFYRLPVIWLFSIASLPMLYRKLFKGKLNVGQITFFLFFWAHTTFFFFMNHRPTRYLIPVIPVMIVMFLFLFYSKEQSKGFNLKKEIIYYPLDVLSSFLFIYFAFSPFLMKLFKGCTFSLNLKYSLILSLLLPLFFYFIFLNKRFVNFISNYKSYIFALLLLTSFACDAPQFLKWKKERTYTVYNIAKELNQKLDNAFIAGLTAPVAVMESKHKSLFLFPKFVNYDKPYEKYPITHSLLASFNREINMHFKDFPHIYKNSKLLKNYGVKDQFLHLYSLNSPHINTLQIKGSILNGQIFSHNKCERNICYTVLSDGKITIKSLGNIKLEKGENSFSYNLPHLSKGSLTLYFKNKKWENKHRYEAEKFNFRVGENIFDKDYSAKFYRYYNKRKMRSSYLSYGPFIIYNSGIMKLSFKLKFEDFKTKIKSLAVIDIYSVTDKKTLIKKEIRPKDIKDDGIYTLYLPLKKQKELEFRVFATKNSSIIFDYVDLDYYEGKVIDLNKEL